jgi:hypothetical protein
MVLIGIKQRLFKVQYSIDESEKILVEKWNTFSGVVPIKVKKCFCKYKEDIHIN